MGIIYSRGLIEGGMPPFITSHVFFTRTNHMRTLGFKCQNKRSKIQTKDSEDTANIYGKEPYVLKLAHGSFSEQLSFEKSRILRTC